MKTPYPELSLDVAELVELVAALDEWNRAIQRSIDEYHLHPQARCDHFGNCTKRYRRQRAAQA